MFRIKCLTMAAFLALLPVGAAAQSPEASSTITITSDELNVPFGQLSTSLAGRLPGLYVIQQTGLPGEGAKLLVRGVTTTGQSSSPLVIVDGAERDLDLVDVDDIESITLLKDAAATVLYGVKGGNGVIVVKTKHGTVSEPKLSVDARYGIASPITLPSLAGAQEWMEYTNDLYTQAGVAAPFSPEKMNLYLGGTQSDLYPCVDWTSKIYSKSAGTAKVGVKVSGGTERTRYFVGGSFYNEDGILNTDSSDSYNPQVRLNKLSFRSNLDIDVTPSTKLSVSLSTQFTSYNAPVVSMSTIYDDVLFCTPIATPAVFSDGSLAQNRSYNAVNPWNDVNSQGYKHNADIYAQSLVSLVQDFSSFFVDGLKAGFNFSWDASNGNSLSRYRNPIYYYMDADGTLQAKNDGSNYLTLSRYVTGSSVMYLEPFVSFERGFGRHFVSARVQMNLRHRTDNVPDSSIYSYAYRHLGFGAAISYNYAGMYFLDAGFSYSGTNAFEKGYRYGKYPALAAAWVLSEEDFWNKDFFSNFKLKASWGLSGTDGTGSDDRRFVYFGALDTDASSATFGTTAQNTPYGISTRFNAVASAPLETIRKANAGVEFRIKEKINFSAEYFNEKRTGIFIEDFSVPATAGFGTQYVNLGAVSNRGIDLSAAFSQRCSGGLDLNFDANFCWVRSRVEADGRPTQLNAYQNKVGYPVSQYFGLEAIGIFQSEEEIASSPVQTFGTVNVGDIKYRDVNGDNKIDSYDITAIGFSSLPEISYGFGASAVWKGFDLSLRFAGQANVSRMIGSTAIQGGASDHLCLGQIYSDVLRNRWTDTNTDAKYPRMYLEGSANNSVESTWWLEDVSFLRLTNAELGYTLPESASRKIGMSFLRVFLSAANPLTLSSFKLWDPELDTTYGSAYPRMSAYLLGVNIKF